MDIGFGNGRVIGGMLIEYSESKINVDSAIGKVFDRLFPLPPPERRRASAFLLKYMGPKLRVERDADYLTYICYKFMLIIYMLFLALIVCDSYAGTNVLIAPGAFARDKLFIPVAFTRFSVLPTLIVTFAFYLRIRVSLNLRYELIPSRLSRYALRHPSQWSWIAKVTVGIALGVWGLLYSDLVVRGVVHRIEWGESLPVVLAAQSLWNVCLASLPNCLIGFALTLEKAVRFFPEAQQDLERADY